MYEKEDGLLFKRLRLYGLTSTGCKSKTLGRCFINIITNQLRQYSYMDKE